MTASSILQTCVVRQHTVPRFLLRHFSATGKGKRARLHAFDKTSGRAYATTPEDATVRNSFYDLDDHPERLSLEPLLGIYENEAAPVIASLLQHRDIRKLTDQDRYTLAAFVAVQRARTYGELQRITHVVDGIAARVIRMGATPNQVNAALGSTPGRNLQNLFLQRLADQDSHIGHLLHKDWYLFETTSEHPFYISDNPVVLNNDNDFGIYGNLGLTVTGIQLYLPLSSTLSLGMLCPSIRAEKVAQKKKIEHYIAFSPGSLSGCDDPFRLIAECRAFIQYETLRSLPEHVKWHNRLQAEFAEQYLFCEKNEFTLVREMLADDPSLRSGFRLTF